jgi:phage baseplate assembly protein gpV
MASDFWLGPPAVPASSAKILHTRVVSTRDSTGLGLVTVAVPWLGDVVAQVAVPMAGPNRGTWFIPQENDEVLVLLTEYPALSAYVIGCLWTSRDVPPRRTPDAPANQMIRTPGGQELTFDDAGTTVTLSTKEKKQEIRMSATGIEVRVKGEAGTAEISIDPAGAIQVSGTSIELKATAKLSLSAPQVELAASGVCKITGSLVTIN